MTRLYVTVLGVLILVTAGGYFLYEHWKQEPPTWLIKAVTTTTPPPPLPEGDQTPLVVPEGFVATIYSREVPGARVMVRDPKGALLVSSTKNGTVVALPDLDGNGVADKAISVLEGLAQPHGLYVRCPDTGNVSADQDACVLYVAETGALKAYAYDADTYSARFQETVATFPAGGGHFTRTLLAHPDGQRLLISIGSSCNVCVEQNPMRASVQAFSFATGELSTFAAGLRNTVFMAINPVSGAIWGTDNGRDLIGDDIPPDEVNILVEGKNYGWPYCYGKSIRDRDFGPEEEEICASTAPSLIDLPAHAAALGLAFVPEEGWPEEYWHDLIIALHGSWNRSEPAGYKVVRVDLTPDGRAVGSPVVTDFVTGFLPEGSKDTNDAIGRPVGVLAEPGGILYISDDRAGAVYRVTRAF